MPRWRDHQILARAVGTALMLALVSSAAQAATVQTTYPKVDGGRVDFGSGDHSFGAPNNGGVVTWVYDIDDTGHLVVTARVQGTLYWDNVFSSGCGRVTIRFRRWLNFSPGHETAATRTIDVCGPGGNANNGGNQRAVDESFSDPDLADLTITVNEIVSGKPLSGTSAEIDSPTSRHHPFKINSGTADFGSGSHSFGGPSGDARVNFYRGNPAPEAIGSVSFLSAVVKGTLYWDSLVSSGCARIVIDFREEDGTNIETRTRDICGPGADANNSANKRSIEEDLAGNPLWKVRVRVGSLAGTSFVGVTSQTFDYNGLVGTFVLEPEEAATSVQQLFRYALTWTAPEPKSWHDLETVRFRIRDETTTLLDVRWDETTNTFSLFNEASGRFGQARPAGSAARLQTPAATLFLEDTSVSVVNSPLGSGPTSPAVMLNLALGFKPSSTGRPLYVDVAASDDQGNSDPWVQAGTLIVER